MKFNMTIDDIEEIYPGIFRIILPLPGRRPGPVNALLFRGEKNVLVDTGARHTVFLLKKAFRKIGFSFDRLDEIIVTHGHIDHYGAARKIIQLSGNRAILSAHAEDVYNIKTGQDAPAKTYTKYLYLMGVPFFFIGIMYPLLFMGKILGQSLGVNRTLKDGDIVQVGDYQAKIISTPGHSKGSICLFLENEKILVAGDHIIDHITPNAFVILNEDELIPERLSQKEYYQSLEKVEALSPELVVPAHGKLINDLGKVADGYRVSFEKRKKNILSILKNDSRTVYQIARSLFPELGGKRFILELFLAISEVFTHLQVIEAEGNVSFTVKNEVLFIQK